jgi:phosphate transport system ATP-binding protein
MTEKPILETRGLSVAYDGKTALRETDLSFRPGEVAALIGPSGCGKSTFLRCLNLMNNEVDAARVTGEVLLDGDDVNAPGTDVYEVRRRVGMVFQQPTPFRRSIRDNVLFAPRRHGVRDKAELDRLLEESLTAAALWDEVKGRLDTSALALSGGQQQRLCIARTLAMRPDAILFDEPCAALDPIATFAVEETLGQVAARGVACVVVTHNLEQAARASDTLAYFHTGRVVEKGATRDLFTAPKTESLEHYLTGRFG